jgi:hypothetical protein
MEKSQLFTSFFETQCATYRPGYSVVTKCIEQRLALAQSYHFLGIIAMKWDFPDQTRM